MRKVNLLIVLFVLVMSFPVFAQENITINIGFQNGFTDETASGLSIEGFYASGQKDLKGRDMIVGGGIVTADENCHKLDDGTRYCSDSNAIQLYYGYRWTRPITQDRVLKYELQGNVFAALAWWDYSLDEKEVGITGGVQGRASFLFDLGTPVTLGIGLDIGIGIGVYKETGIGFYMPLGGHLVIKYDL